MQQDLWLRSRAIVSMLRVEIERRVEDGADKEDVARAVLDELTPPGWRYQLYPKAGQEDPDFLLIPAAFVG